MHCDRVLRRVRSMTRLLIVDDDEAQRNALRDLLVGHGFAVDLAQQGSDALEFARAAPPAIVLCDLLMPVMDGYMLLSRFKSDPNLRQIPFVMLTPPYDEPQDAAVALTLGAHAALRKPFTSFSAGASASGLERLLAIIADALARPPPLCEPAVQVCDERWLEQCSGALLRRLEAKAGLQERARSQSLLREEQMRMALSAARMGTWDWDLASGRLSWIDGYTEQPSVQPAAYEGTYADFERTVHADDREGLRRALQKALETHSEYEHEYRVLLAHGVEDWIEGRGRPFYDAAGQPVRMAGIYVNVTERRRVQEQLRTSQKMEAIGLLAGGIAHDFNNVLGAIVGNAELARRDIGPRHAALRSLDEIDRASQRAKNLVQQILAFSRKQQVETRVIGLRSVVEETASLLRATLPANIDLEVVCLASAPDVLADSTQIHQVLLNLVTNAWHAIGGLRGRIEMRLAAAPGPERQAQFARLSVTDSGAGMDAATLARAFEPFFTTKPKGHGTGLGLSVVAEIVKQHGGVISVTSAPTQGTSFRIDLPAAVSAQPDRSAASAVSRDVKDSQRMLKERILYIDDEAALVKLVSRMLQPFGYSVSGFAAPRLAVASFRSDPSQFDLVITDFNMPDMNGLEVARELIALRPDLPVMLVSGYVTDELKERALATGVREVLSKPVTTNQLRRAIRDVLRTAAVGA
jgi:signal transduction histidine kinase/DNA-binding response OmpR family regulator